MTRRLVLSYLAVTLVVLVVLEVPLAVFYGDRERDRLAVNAERDATVLASLYEDALERATPLAPDAADRYERRTDARVVVVDADGIARVDTGGTVPRDFSTRPEVVDALAGQRATGTRRSDTLGTDLLYVAVPVASGGRVHGAVRVTLDAAQVDDRIRRFWLGLAGVAAVVLATMVLVGWALARSIARPVQALTADAARFAAGDLTVGAAPARAPAEVRDLSASMATMATRLREVLDAQRAFVADASHQLRTPLTALRLRLENLQGRLPEAAGPDLDAAVEEIDRLTRLVADLLRLARAEERTERVTADLATLAAERVDTWSAVAEGAGVRLVLDRPASAVLVRTVPGAVEQVVDNLVDNALAVSSEGATVTVRVAHGPGTGRLQVVDQGPGLDDAQKARAVRRFWRGDQATPGTGLGLAIVDALVTASGGALRLLDAPDAGLLVQVDLPLVDRSAPGSG